MYKISELHHSDVAKESVKISKTNQKLKKDEQHNDHKRKSTIRQTGLQNTTHKPKIEQQEPH